MKKNKSLIHTVTKMAHHIGKVICYQNKVTNQAELYLIMGLSYENMALVRLYEQSSMNEVLAQKCYRLLRMPVFGIAPLVISLPLYADVTKLLIKEFSLILPLLNKEHMPFRIAKDDVHQIIVHIKEINTIADSIKDTYLNA